MQSTNIVVSKYNLNVTGNSKLKTRGYKKNYTDVENFTIINI